jgi:hypothetical protein
VSEPRPGRAGEPEPDWVPDVSGWSDADFWAMARRVRQTAEEELAEIEWETERAELKREDLAARSLRAMMEGERWQLSAGARVVEGQVVHVGLDFTAVADRAGNRHDIAHRAVELIRVVAVEPGSGRAPASLRPATLRARLLDLEQVDLVELASARGSWALRGTIDSVNVDHLVLVDTTAQVSVVPLDAIGTVTRVTAEHRRRARGSERGLRPR